MSTPTNLQWQIRRTLQCMSPWEVAGQQKIRIGGTGDGGYIMLDRLSKIKAAYSLGIGGDVSWDQAIAEYGVPIYQFDHTVDAPPIENPFFKFRKNGIGAKDNGVFLSIASILKQNGHLESKDLILKIDIECAEWEVFDDLSTSIFVCFDQIVVELHSFLRLREHDWLSRAQRVLGKLYQSHVPFHVHANNWGDFQIIEGIPIPDVIEVSYLRRDRHVIKPSSEFYPTPLDFPCHPDRPDIMLGSFRFF